MPFSIGNHHLNSSRFFVLNGGVSRQTQIDMRVFFKKIQFLYVYKTRFTLPTDTNSVIAFNFYSVFDSGIFTLLVWSICCRACVFTFHFAKKQVLGWNSFVKLGPEDICCFNYRTTCSIWNIASQHIEQKGSCRYHMHNLQALGL